MTSSNAMRVILVAGLMVLSSLAGCISTDDSNTDDTSIIIDDTTTPLEPVIFGNVMVSTYHVGELAKAVGGDNIVVEYMSQENIPVHDYEPSLTDLVRLQNSDLFLYHGLDLEPWVESTLSSMENAPPHYMTHTMPVGEATVDYDSFLVSNLCDLMLEGPFESVTMGMIHDDHDDHEPPRYSQVFHDLDIYGTGDLYDLTVTVHFDEDAKYNDDGDLVALMEERVNFTVVYEFDRELADGDTGIVFANMESTSVGPFGQSAGGSPVSSSHTERTYFQSHMAEYGTGPIGAEEGINSIEITITARDDPNNNPLVLDDGVVEFDFNVIWVEDDDHDDHSAEEGDHDDHSDEEEHHEKGALVIHIEEEGDYGFALPSDIEMFILMGEGGHDDHDHHDDHDGDDHDDHDDDMVCYDMSTHTVDSSITAEEDCVAAGLIWTAANSGPGGDDDHDEGHEGDGDGEIDAGEGEEAFEYDPHSWLDPLSFNEQLNLVKEKMTLTFPEGAEIFASNAAAYSVDLIQLHSNFQDAFGDQGSCEAAGLDATIVANHNAYSYISVRYGVDIMTVHGLDPEGEPSPAEVAEVVEHIKEEGITVLYVEEYTDQTAVQSIVEETGVQIKILYTMEMRPTDSDDDYISMMNKNVQNMVAGIGC